MAKKKLGSIVWPNLPNDTYILDAGKVEFDKDETYSANTVGEVLQQKANIDGSYSDLTAGSAEQLISTVRTNDKTPYLFRTSGGSVDIGDREFVNAIVGGTVAFNQLVHNGDFASSSGWSGGLSSISVSNNVATLTPTSDGTERGLFYNADMPYAIANHKYLLTIDVYAPITATCALTYGGSYSSSPLHRRQVVANTWTKVSVIWTTPDSNIRAKLYALIAESLTTSQTVKYRNATAIDLTQMFGSIIADYIYSLETATAGAGVAFFKKLGFNKPYYAYNAGELKSVSGLSSHDMTGFNQWDEEWELGKYDSNGQKIADSERIRSVNYIPVLPNTAYYVKIGTLAGNYVNVYYYDANKTFISYGTPNASTHLFTTPQNCAYMTFFAGGAYGTTYNHDICISLNWDGSRNGEYEPYELHSYPLDSTLTLRGVPKLDASNNLYYDGDTYEADGTVTRKYGVVDLGTLNWVNEGTYFRAGTEQLGRKGTLGDNYVAPMICSIYTASYLNDSADKVITSNMAGSTIYTRDTAKASMTAEQYKSAMSGAYLIYELATPTTETADPYTTPQIVNDFGTEEFVTTGIVPVGHDTDYPINLVAKLEMAPNSPDGDGTYVVKQTNGMNEYVPLIIPSGIPAVPTTDGTYKLTVTVSDGTPTLSWEA